MGVAAIFVLGLATFFNMFAIKWKLENERYADAGLDGAILVGLGYVFGGSITGLAIATVSSAIFSVYLLVSPPKMDWMDE